MVHGRAATLCLGAFGLYLATSTAADDDADAVRCISMGSVRTTKIIDDEQLLFYERGGRIYLNRLDRTCVGLRRSGKFTFKVQSGARHVRVCSTDTISVLESTGRGFSCGLGEFQPIREDVAAQLLGEGNDSRAIVAEPVDLPKEPEPVNE